jgi:hypothetical protein
MTYPFDHCILLIQASHVDGPHLVITYCALLALAVLMGDYTSLDLPTLARMVGAYLVADGGVPASCIRAFDRS